MTRAAIRSTSATGRSAAAEHDVELAHQRELARRCGAQVAGADDEPTVVAEEEHASNLTPATDSRRAAGATFDRPQIGLFLRVADPHRSS